MALTALNVPPHLQNETFFEIKSFSTKPIQEELLPYHNGPFLFFLTLHFISLSNKIVRVPEILAPAFLMALDLRVGACNPLVVATSGLLRGGTIVQGPLEARVQVKFLHLHTKLGNSAIDPSHGYLVVNHVMYLLLRTFLFLPLQKPQTFLLLYFYLFFSPHRIFSNFSKKLLAVEKGYMSF